MSEKYDYEMDLEQVLEWLSRMMVEATRGTIWSVPPLDTENYVWNGTTLKFNHVKEDME